MPLPQIARRIMYLGYYFKQMEWDRLSSFMDHASKSTGRSKISLWKDMIRSSLKYNISPLEYFNFHFYEIPPEQKASYAGTGYMYEYQLLMNPRGKRSVLEDKWQFLKSYAPFVKHSFASLAELEEDPSKARELLSNPSGKIVLKSIDGQCGRGIEIRPTNDFTPESLVKRLKETGNNLAEEFVMQHKALNALSPSGLNTLRIITQLNDRDEVELVGARLRITVNSAVDNLAAGNIAAPVDIETGKVEGKAVFSDITKEPVSHHPVTGVKLLGFEVPYFRESVQLATAAAVSNTSNRSIGWDIAITKDGPELIEGNHDWCKLLWQLPVSKGLKPVLESYRS